MKMEERKPHKHAEVIKAWADGAHIEYYHTTIKKWCAAYTPSWNESCEYRIKPEPKLVPFDFSDAEKLIGRIIKRNSYECVPLNEGMIKIIHFVSKSYVNDVSYKGLLDYYTFLDGSPCGKYIEE